MINNFESQLKEKLLEGIKEHAEQLLDRHLKEYESELLRKMRQVVSTISLEIFRTMELRQMGDGLIIEIKDLTK